MEIFVESLARLSDTALLATYHRARRLYAENKFARDSELIRLEWQGARMFATMPGRVTERHNAVKSSESLTKKELQICEMTRDLDLLKADVDVLAMALRTRAAASALAPEQDQPEDRFVATG